MNPVIPTITEDYRPELDSTYDVIVVGGGPAGCRTRTPSAAPGADDGRSFPRR